MNNRIEERENRRLCCKVTKLKLGEISSVVYGDSYNLEWDSKRTMENKQCYFKCPILSCIKALK